MRILLDIGEWGRPRDEVLLNTLQPPGGLQNAATS